VRRHDVDGASLVAGLLFVGIAIAYLAAAYTDLRIGAGWLLPIVLIGLGLAGLAGSIRRAHR
jgi:hypothetical protein